MSFMFKPLAYDDPNPINYISLSEEPEHSLVFGTTRAGTEIARYVLSLMESRKTGGAVIIDGYAGASFAALTGAICQYAAQQGVHVVFQSMEDFYLPAKELDRKFASYLPEYPDMDPVCLFGKLFEGSFDDVLDHEKVQIFLNEYGKKREHTLILLVGYGSAFEGFAELADASVFIDITPKTAAIRARNGEMKNIGDRVPRKFAELMRRNYYIDFEIILKNRKSLIESGRLDFYVSGDHHEEFVLVPRNAFEGILGNMAKQPFRCKPVYLEGIWGGEFIRKVRRLPDSIKNVAWIFEMIPMEVSLVADVNGKKIEFPFSTFLQAFPNEIMGEACRKEFQGYFPIRFNYDDTYHSNGNMSVQVHPDEALAMAEFGEKGAQDEAYYIIATGHGAKTYLGFKENADTDDFLDLVELSEKDGRIVDYTQYINALESKPGLQVMIPGGTIHASGRNQFILELGSLTVGSYTFKLYDYNRRDGEGQLRPIHSAYGRKALKPDRTAEWVEGNIVIPPRLLSEGEGYKEYLVGQTDLMYYETHRLEIETGGEVTCCGNGQFTVLTLVDGEDVLVLDQEHPTRAYHQKFLDIVIVPAQIQRFVIRNIGYQPCVVHKTLLRESYSRHERS